MPESDKNFHWKNQKKAADYKAISCPTYDTYKDFTLDKTGYYVLIRVDFEYYRIEVAICNKEHEIEKVFTGQTCQSLYHTIFKYEKTNKLEWFSEKKHMAYLGKELKKAEIALATGNSGYFQE